MPVVKFKSDGSIDWESAGLRQNVTKVLLKFTHEGVEYEQEFEYNAYQWAEDVANIRNRGTSLDVNDSGQTVTKMLTFKEAEDILKRQKIREIQAMLEK